MVRALRKASTQSLPSSNTGYALGMAGYRLFNKKFNTRNDVPKVLIAITDGRYIRKHFPTLTSIWHFTNHNVRLCNLYSNFDIIDGL